MNVIGRTLWSGHEDNNNWKNIDTDRQTIHETTTFILYGYEMAVNRKVRILLKLSDYDSNNHEDCAKM